MRGHLSNRAVVAGAENFPEPAQQKIGAKNYAANGRDKMQWLVNPPYLAATIAQAATMKTD